MLRINLLGGPNSSKTTTAAHLFSYFKSRSFKIEYVNEFIKEWAYLKREPKSFDPIFILSNQLHKEDFFFQYGIEYIVTDSPLMLQVFYAYKSGFNLANEMLKIAMEFDKAYPSINIFLDGKNVEFQDVGRFHNQEESVLLNKEIEEFLTYHKVKYKIQPSSDKHKVAEYLHDILK